MNKYSKKKSDQLGVNFSTACHTLRKCVMFSLLQETHKNLCFRCGKLIAKAEDLSLDHKEDWLDKANAKVLFFDLSNVTYSHRRCNTLAMLDKRTNCRGVTAMRGKKKRKKPYTARFWNGKKQVHIGYFTTPEEAKKALDDHKTTL